MSAKSWGIAGGVIVAVGAVGYLATRPPPKPEPGFTFTDAAQTAPWGKVERVGEAAAPGVLEAAKSQAACKYLLPAPTLVALSNKAIFEMTGLADASPLRITRAGSALKPYVQPAAQACDDTFTHAPTGFLVSPIGDDAAGPWSVDWMTEVKLASKVKGKPTEAWWVPPGTTLRLGGALAGEGKPATVPVVVEALLPGSATNATIGLGEVTVPLTVNGRVASGRIEVPTRSDGWQIEITAPAEGGPLLLRRVVVGDGATQKVLIELPEPPGGAGVGVAGLGVLGAGLAGREIAAAKAPPAVDGTLLPAPDAKITTLPAGVLRIERYAELAPGTVNERAGVSGCSPLIVTENGTPLPKPHATFKEVAEVGKGASVVQGTRILFTAPDNSDPTKNGRTYAAALDPARRCGNAAWVYPGDEVTVSAPVAGRLGGPATGLELVAHGFVNPASTLSLAVTVRVDDVAVSTQDVAIHELGKGVLLPFAAPVGEGARKVEVVVTTPADAPFLLFTRATLASTAPVAPAAGGGEAAASKGPSVGEKGPVVFDLSAPRGNPSEVMRLTGLDVGEGKGELVAAKVGGKDGLRLTVTAPGASRACTARFGVRGPGEARAKVAVPSLTPGQAKWQTLRLDATYFGADKQPVKLDGKLVQEQVLIAEGKSLTTVKLPMSPPEGAVEAQVCVRFAQATGVVEIGGLEVEGR